MSSSPSLDRLAAVADFWRMGEASALARYSDLDAAAPEDAFRRAFVDGAAAALAQFPAAILGTHDAPGWSERLCDPDAVPGTARPVAAGMAWEPPPGFAPGSVAERAIGVQAAAYAPEAAGLVPLDAYVLGFKRGAAAALYIVQDAAASLYEFHAALARVRPPQPSPPAQETPAP